MSAHRIPLAGVIGAPVAHSRSPRLFAHWLETLGIEGHYAPLHVEPDDFEQVVRALPRMGFRGANVTLPHKIAALGIADQVSDRAARIGAANTLTFRDDGIHADNTDGHGFISNLRQSAPGWAAADGPAVVLGAGGAARAVLDALIEAGAPEIRLANRTRARAEALAEAFGPAIRVIDWAETAPALDGAATVVNTTSLGMQGADPFDLDLSALPASALATDIVYTPLDTPMLIAARDRGCRTVDGLGMLLHQAVPGFARWFGATPQVTEATRAAVLG
ncbi:shikimate dehydrogenase [Limimaricola hongkongensis]|uniref:Shikimate dehydrogenase (NADP(+)) n=1 Tax=Limimaricola hongkongensis DSM 17492 TaxID=1122180 RepID=A0A017HF95_9RHOB|nr:shikimate dehydrogenase [Limimaricola hongkongensis]EYD73167.1 Shikimate 5-dehydrogenase I alpha [Limimaricola hongkongensis DSM 17492]